MKDEDDIPLSELLKPVSAKVQPKRASWSSGTGSADLTEEQRMHAARNANVRTLSASIARRAKRRG